MRKLGPEFPFIDYGSCKKTIVKDWNDIVPFTEVGRGVLSGSPHVYIPLVRSGTLYFLFLLGSLSSRPDLFTFSFPHNSFGSLVTRDFHSLFLRLVPSLPILEPLPVTENLQRPK